MRRRILLLTLLLPLLFGFARPAAAQEQEGEFEGLASYLREKLVGDVEARLIALHLKESGAVDHLAELVAWARADFPDQKEEGGTWKTDTLGLKLAVVHSIQYFVRGLPAEQRAQKYLEALDELGGDEYLTHHLAQTASLFVDEEALRARAFELLGDPDPRGRVRGALMVCGLASSRETVLERCTEALHRDVSRDVRNNILIATGSLRDHRLQLQKAVASLHFHSLTNDPDRHVRQTAAGHLRAFADAGKLITGEDLPLILGSLLKAADPSVRETLGRMAARLTTDRRLWIAEDKLTDALLAGFVRRVRSAERRTGRTPDDEAVVAIWSDWWSPLVPRYTEMYRVVH